VRHLTEAGTNTNNGVKYKNTAKTGLGIALNIMAGDRGYNQQNTGGSASNTSIIADKII